MCPDSFGTNRIGYQPGFGCNIDNYCASIVPHYPNFGSVVYDPMRMDCSAFGADVTLNSEYADTMGVGALGYYGGGCGDMGAMGAMGGYAYNPDSMYQQMDKWTDYMYDRQAKYTEKARQNDLRINGPMEALQYAADALKEKIEADDQPQIKIAFEKYKETLKGIYPELAQLNDKQLCAKAMELYKDRHKVGLKDDIRANSNGQLAQKFMNGLTFGKFFKGSAEETIEDLTGNEMSTANKCMGGVGTAAGVATALTATTYTGLKVIKNPGAVLKFCGRNWLGLAIAGAAAAIGWASTSK